MINTVFALALLIGCHQSTIGKVEAFAPPGLPQRTELVSLQYSRPESDDVSGNNRNMTFSTRNDTAPNDFNNNVDIHYSRSKKFPDRKVNKQDQKKMQWKQNKKKSVVREFLSSSLSSIKGKIGRARSGESVSQAASTDDKTSVSSSFSGEDHQNPLCDIDDEDCLSFSTLDPEYNSLMFHSGEASGAESLCDAQDVDCQALLSKTYLHSDSFLAADLRSRSESIISERVYDNWMGAHCPTSFVSVQDWVRHVDMETYPIAVCGGARGGVYVVNLENKNVIAKVDEVHSIQVDQGGANPSKVNTNTEVAKQAMEKLYGKIDGGGVVSVAISGDLVASSGREGGVKLWKIERRQALPPVESQEEEQGFGRDSALRYGKLSQMAGNTAEKGKNSDRSEFKNLNDAVEGKLLPLGSLRGLDKTIVTSLSFDSKQRLWAAAFDGTTRCYDVSKCDDSNFRISTQIPLFQSDFTDSVLDMHLCEELRIGACATADGGVALFSLEDGQFFVGIMLFEVAARSVLILKQKNGSYDVLCGGSNGQLHQIPLNIDLESNRVDQDNPFDVSEYTDTAITPKHTGPVMCLASPNKGSIAEGIFISGGQDGSVRVWDSNTHESGSRGTDVVGIEQPRPVAKCIYALTGYKLWLGSVCTDGQRIVSDGGKNSLIVRDFSKEKGNGKASL